MSNVHQVNADGDLAPACPSKVVFGRGLNTGTVVDLARKPHNSVSLHMFLLIFELLPLRWLWSDCG